MTWVKLCGMTRRQDVVAAEAVGADAVGFVVYDGSPRQVKVEDVARLGEGIEVERFLVTVDATAEVLIEAARVAGVTGVQPHGRHARTAAVAARRAGYAVLFPVPVGDAPADLGEVPAGCIPILDHGGRRHGGTGIAFDWGLAAGVGGNWVLAGGLTPGTVATAVDRLSPWGVDVASGIEVRPGVKDHDLMRRFVEAAR